MTSIKKIVLNEKKYDLNPSSSKYVSVGIDENFDPCVKIGGLKKAYSVLFSELEWKNLLKQQGVITNGLYPNSSDNPVITETFIIKFENINDKRIINIGKGSEMIYLGYESVYKLWELVPLINYRIDMLKRLDFQGYFSVIRGSAHKFTGDVPQNVMNFVQYEINPNSENVSIILEMCINYPNMVENKCLENRYMVNTNNF